MPQDIAKAYLRGVKPLQSGKYGGKCTHLLKNKEYGEIRTEEKHFKLKYDKF